jgi:predicted negative regulator of RcsB-dependent stress response
MFMLNVGLYLTSLNVCDSLGEAFAKKGDKRTAIDNHERALRLNPATETARKALQDLRR